MTITRRALVTSGTALAAAGALTGPALLDWAKAWAQTAPWKPESGAQLSMLRWKYFVQSEDDAFVALIDAFTKATGVKVNISRESYEDVQPKASVAANTGSKFFRRNALQAFGQQGRLPPCGRKVLRSSLPMRLRPLRL